MARLIPTRAPGEADDEYRARLVAHRDHQRRELRRALWLIAQGAAACALIWWFTSQMCAQGRDIALYGPPGVSRVAPRACRPADATRRLWAGFRVCSRNATPDDTTTARYGVPASSHRRGLEGGDPTGDGDRPLASVRRSRRGSRARVSRAHGGVLRGSPGVSTRSDRGIDWHATG